MSSSDVYKEMAINRNTSTIQYLSPTDILSRLMVSVTMVMLRSAIVSTCDSHADM